jgi:hypothetical protein
MLLRRRLAEEAGMSMLEIERVVPLSIAPSANQASAPEGGRAIKPQKDDPQSRAPWRKKGPPMGAPAPRIKRAGAGLELQLIARMMQKPPLAGRFDIATTEHDETELGTAGRVASFIRDHDGEPINQAMVMEHFRETADSGAVMRAAMLLSEVDVDRLDVDAEFAEALDRVRERLAKVSAQEDILRRARERGLS